MNTLSAIHAKYGNDPMKFASACKLLAEDSKLTIDQIDTKLSAQAGNPASATAAPVAAAPAAKPLELSAIVAKFGSDKDRLAVAFQFVAGKPDATLEQIDAHLAAADAAEMKKLREENAKLKADKDAADKKAAALAASGHPGVVNTGAGTGTSGNVATKAECFKRGGSLTDRVMLMRQDPELAKQLAAEHGFKLYGDN